jgi:hypothetical protein
MRRVAIHVVSWAAVVSGCTPMHWVKPDASADQFRADQQDCQQKAWREAQNRTWMYRMEPVVGPGFAVWPSGAFADPSAHQFVEESRLAQFCMESKGYKLEAAPKK